MQYNRELLLVVGINESYIIALCILDIDLVCCERSSLVQSIYKIPLVLENEIEETFELAEPGKGFEVYSKVRLIRQK